MAIIGATWRNNSQLSRSIDRCDRDSISMGSAALSLSAFFRCTGINEIFTTTGSPTVFFARWLVFLYDAGFLLKSVVYVLLGPL